MKYNLLNVFVFFCSCFTYSQVRIIDDFKKSSNLNSKEITLNFKDKEGDDIIIRRNAFPAGYYVEDGALHFDRSRASGARNSFNYSCFESKGGIISQNEGWNIKDDAPTLHLNFSHMSRPFKANILLMDSFIRYKYINFNFSPDNLNPTINLLTKVPLESLGHTKEEPDLSQIILFGLDVSVDGYRDDLKFSITSLSTTPEPITFITLSGGFMHLIRKKLKQKFQSMTK